MSDAVELLVKQVEEWESRLKEARETVRVGEAILPSLQETLDIARGVTPAKPAEPAENRSSSESAASPTADGSSDEPPTLRALRKSDEVEEAVIDCLEGLPAQFEQSDVIDALNARGLTANRSTLSQALIRMAKAKVGFEIARPGKGRMATVFENQLAGE